MMIVKSIDGWISADKKNVAAIHCKAGKGRTGTVICSYLLFKGICENPEAALLFFKKKRSSKDKGGSVDEPSQVRFQKK
jgi:protein-tyrosine phosphatase